MESKPTQQNNKPPKPSFPIIMLLLALTKDFMIDPLVFVLTLPPLTPLGWVLGIIASFLIGGVFSLWLLFRQGKGKAIIIQRVVMMVIAVSIGFIPVLRLVIPEFTFLVIAVILFERVGQKLSGIGIKLS